MNKTLLALGIPVAAVLLSLPVEAQYSASRSEAPRMGGWGRTSSQPRMGRSGREMRTGGQRIPGTRDRNPGPRSSTVSLADLEAPKKARKAYEKARQQLSKGEVEKAEANLRKAIELYPEYPSAWSTLGRMLSRQRKLVEAKVAYRTALEADPKSWRAWAGLADIAYAENNWRELAETTERATHVMPVGSTRLWVYKAVAYYSLGELEKAEQSANDAIDRGGWYTAKAYHVLGLVHAAREEFELASAHLKRYVLMAPNAGDLPLVRKQIAYVEEAHRRRTGECGAGGFACQIR